MVRSIKDREHPKAKEDWPAEPAVRKLCLSSKRDVVRLKDSWGQITEGFVREIFGHSSQNQI